MRISLTVIAAAGLISACSVAGNKPASEMSASETDITTAAFTMRVDDNMHTQLISTMAGAEGPLTSFAASEYVVLADGTVVSDFSLSDAESVSLEDEVGTGMQYDLSGISTSGIAKHLVVKTYAEYPGLALTTVTYTNESEQPVQVAKWVNNQYHLKSVEYDDAPEYWAYQGASYADRRDWVTPLTLPYEQENYMGMNASDYGGGTPIADIWRKDAGLAVGHTALTPKLVSLPVSYQNKAEGAAVHIELEKGHELAPGESLSTLETFINVHQKDYYATLETYRGVMAAKGLSAPSIPDTSYEPIWCAWGYERNFTVEEVLNSLEKAKSMGLEWAVLDDGWQTAEGDWYLNPEKFPGGDKDMRHFVDEIHAAGLKAKLWWAPLAVDPGTDLLHEHSDMLLLDENGAVQDVTWWNSFYLCPAYEKTIEHSKALVRKMLQDWGYDGLKIDGQHLNGVAPCYNPAHNHAYPEESVEQLSHYWEEILKTAMEINPDAVVEICPCGTSYAFHNIPYMNQAVSSDPLSSWQIRHKGKTLKGLMGDSAPYYGDHVELSDGASDFATSVGIGAIVGTKFTLEGSTGPAAAFALTPEKEKVWSKWIDLYREKMLPKGNYRGELYDIGFDKPETHAIQKDNSMYYAFYADDWSGDIELRGLQPGSYTVTDYVNGKRLGEVSGNSPVLNVSFSDYLLIEVTPTGDKQ